MHLPTDARDFRSARKLTLPRVGMASPCARLCVNNIRLGDLREPSDRGIYVLRCDLNKPCSAPVPLRCHGAAAEQVENDGAADQVLDQSVTRAPNRVPSSGSLVHASG